MNQKNHSADNIPELRFPEFQDAAGWEEYTLDSICTSISSGKDIHDANGIYNLHGSTGIIGKTSSYTYDGNFILVARVGANAGLLNKASGKFGATDNTLVIIIKKSEKLDFIYYSLDRFGLNKMVFGSGQPLITGKQLKDLSINLPLPVEQQKIADCLTSIADLITAQSQKLDALKTHKKGLMQQLFPFEGETAPKLRFAEFRDKERWEVQEFSKYIVLYRGSSPRPIQDYLTKSNIGVNWIKIGDTKSVDNFIISHVEEKITPKGAEKSRKVGRGELILANSMSFGKTYQLAIDGFIYDGWFVLREYEKYFHKQFLLQLLNSDYMQNQYLKLSAGGIVQNISSVIVYETILPHTSLPEQQKIADCLSSIDELITAQSQKLNALKVHKKGLMQQLFPVAEVQ